MKKLLVLLFSILISFNSYGLFGLFEETICPETDAQIRNDLYYLPNTTKPFTGNILCEFIKRSNYEVISATGKVKKGKLFSQTITWYDKDRKIYRVLDTTKFSKTNNLPLSGKESTFYENGQIKTEENFKDGKLYGLQTEWYENGQKAAEGYAKDDALEGKATYWNESGQIDKEAIFKNGKCISGDCPS